MATIIVVRRFHRSTSVPATVPSSSCGARPASTASPLATVDPVSRYTW
nr:hypothetical protein [Actinocatenispora sera]